MKKCDRCLENAATATVSTQNGDYFLCGHCAIAFEQFMVYHEYIIKQKRGRNWIKKMVESLPEGQVIEVAPDRYSIEHTKQSIYRAAKKMNKKVVCSVYHGRLFVCNIEKTKIRKPFDVLVSKRGVQNG